MVRRRRRIVASKSEILCENALINLGISPTREMILPDLPKLRYDFYFTLGERNYLLEYDGEQHFNFVKYVQRRVSNFRKCQRHDIIKTNFALNNGYYVIRLDHQTVKNRIKDYIKLAILLGRKFYCSNHKKYDYILRTIRN